MKYVKNFLLLALFSLMLVSCAHHDNASEHHHHAYDKHCVYSVAHGDLETMGSEEFKVEHKGVTYYFSTYQKKENFLENMEPMVQEADKVWNARRDK